MYKILRIHNRLIVGGPSLNVTILSSYLQPDFETKLLVGKKDTHEKDASYIAQEMNISPIEISEMRRSIFPLNDIIAYYKIKKIIKEYRPDIVHTHASKAGTIGRLAASSCNVKLIVHTFHGHVFHSYFNKIVTAVIIAIERFLAKKTHAIIAISDLQKKELVETYKIASANKVVTIPLGFNLEKYAIDQDKKRNIFRNKYGFKTDEIIIGIIGRVVPVKNHLMFVEVASKIKQAFNKNVRFAIIGDGDCLPEIKKKAIELNLTYSYFVSHPKVQSDIVVTSWETAIDQVLAGLDIVALTSFNEGTPVSIIEAMAAKRPVVSTNVGGVKDVITHGENGFLTSINDSDSFADYIIQLINDKVLRNKMGNLGFDSVIHKYSRSRLVDDVKKLYIDFLEKT